MKSDRWVCNHCGYDVMIQPPRESGCNHAHYPEACSVCADRARVQKVITDYDWSKSATLFKEDWHNLPGA